MALTEVNTNGSRERSNNKTLTALMKEENKVLNAELEQESKLLELRLANAEKLNALKVELATKEVQDKAEKEFAIAEQMTKQKRLNSLRDLEQEIATKQKSIEDEYKRKESLNGKLTAQQEKDKADRLKAAEKEAQKKFDEDQKYKEKLEKKYEDDQKKRERKEIEEQANLRAQAFSNALSKGSLVDRIDAVKDVWKDPERTGGEKFGDTINALANITKAMENQIEEIAGNKTLIDTRLYGSGNKQKFGSYWDRMSSDITATAGVSPFVKQSDVVSNLKTMVQSGIAFNVEQRAFLATIKDEIATTFDANDSTLRRLIRIQEQDTTAARLGMEASMNAFLNNMYETTEYLSGVAEQVRGNIQEASALMSATDAVGFEYQVQKWMGSLYSVGFSKTSELSSALGKLAAGDISGLTGSGTGNLMVMAANQAGLNIGDILAKGLDESSTNQLMKAMVEYLGGIYKETGNSRVIQQQYAGVFGLAASDLKAAANILNDTTAISGKNVDYSAALGNLKAMAGSIGQRVSIGGMIKNAVDNVKYSMAGSIANSPALYGAYELANILDMAANGVPITTVSYLGNSIDLNTSLSGLLRAGSLGGAALSSLGKIVGIGGGGAGGGGFSGIRMLESMGVDLSGQKANTITRGNGDYGAITFNQDTSSSQVIGTSSGEDIQNKTMNDAKSSGDQEIQAKQEEETDATRTMIYDRTTEIVNLLNAVINGEKAFTVKQENYGLTSLITPGLASII